MKNELLIALKEVLDLTHLGRSNLYRLMEIGIFPKPIKISERNVRWKKKDVLSYLENRGLDLSNSSKKECTNKWINVNDILPLWRQEILFCSNGKNFLPTTFGIYLGEDYSTKAFYSHDRIAYDATHWQPLPQPMIS